MTRLLDSILTLEDAAQCFAALGSEQRLSVLQALVAAGPKGLTAGALAERTGIGASTLTHHLRFLSQSGLIAQRKDGRQVISTADFARVEQVSRYLLINCCAEAPAPHEHHKATP